MLNSLNLPKRIVLILSILILSVLGLSACGQKGSLYLPTIPPSPSLVSDGQESAPVSKNEALTDQNLTDQDESSKVKKDKNITE